MDRRAFIAAGAAFAASPALARNTDDLQTTLERLRTEAGIPALGGAIVTPERITWSGVSGVRLRGGDAPVTAGDRWHLGSNTKAMTSALYARLVEQGRARWGAPVAGLFPDIEANPAWADITIEQLFGHRAGVLDPAVMPGWMTGAWTATDVRETRTALARTVVGAAPGGPVGSFAYSNAGYIVAGAAIERITGEPWEETMRREVFDPLGMTSASFGAPTGDSPWGHRTAQIIPMDPARPGADNPAGLGPAGTVHATLEDYARFLRAFLTDGGGWLSGESVTRLATPVAGEGQAYALGWGVIERSWSGGRPALTHDGSNTMWLARAVIAPGRNAAAICVANAADASRPAIDGLTQALIAAFPN